MEPLIREDLVVFDLEAAGKLEVIEALASRMEAAGRVTDRKAYVDAVLAREKIFATAVGFSVAIPHAKTDAAKTATVAFARLKNPVVWDQDEKVSMVFQLAIPAGDQNDTHLRLLASLSRKLVHGDFRADMASAATPQEVVDLICDM